MFYYYRYTICFSAIYESINAGNSESMSTDMTQSISMRTLMSLFLNVFSSVGVIFVNKILFRDGFNFAVLLTIIHFIVTFLGCVFFAYMQYFERKKLTILSVLPISLAFCGYVVFNNLSLATNSVSIYQISKILCTPLIVAVESYNGKRETQETLLTLVPVCIGVAITFFGAVDLNWIGILWIALAVIANSFYTVWGKTKQTELQVTPMQILTYQAPLSAVMLLAALPLDGIDRIAKTQLNVYIAGLMVMSCVLAFGVNFSFFLFVGQTSPLTMNVVGYLKTCLVFLIGFLFTDSNPSVQSVTGISMTLLGLALYTRSKLKPLSKSNEKV